jgi:hypothetical protein
MSKKWLWVALPLTALFAVGAFWLAAGSKRDPEAVVAARNAATAAMQYCSQQQEQHKLTCELTQIKLTDLSYASVDAAFSVLPEPYDYLTAIQRVPTVSKSPVRQAAVLYFFPKIVRSADMSRLEDWTDLLHHALQLQKAEPAFAASEYLNRILLQPVPGTSVQGQIADFIFAHCANTLGVIRQIPELPLGEPDEATGSAIYEFLQNSKLACAQSALLPLYRYIQPTLWQSHQPQSLALLKALWPSLLPQQQTELLADVMAELDKTEPAVGALKQIALWLPGQYDRLTAPQRTLLLDKMPVLIPASGGALPSLAAVLLNDPDLVPDLPALEGLSAQWLKQTEDVINQHSIWLATLDVELSRFKLLRKSRYDAAFAQLAFAPIYYELIDVMQAYQPDNAMAGKLVKLDIEALSSIARAQPRFHFWYRQAPTLINSWVKAIPDTETRQYILSELPEFSRWSLQRYSSDLVSLNEQQLDAQNFAEVAYLKLHDKTNLNLPYYIDSWQLRSQLNYMHDHLLKEPIKQHQLRQWQQQYRLDVKVEL